MRATSLTVLLLTFSTFVMAQDPPTDPAPETAPAPETVPAPETATTSEPAPAPAPPAAPVPPPPPILLPPPAEVVHPTEIAVYGFPKIPSPAHRLAAAEAQRPLVVADPMLEHAAEVLEELTGRYLEDAPRIAELTLHTVNLIRVEKLAASPFEILEGALRAKRPASLVGNVPLRYEHFASRYVALRIKGKKSHADALSTMEAEAKAVRPALAVPVRRS